MRRSSRPTVARLISAGAARGRRDRGRRDARCSWRSSTPPASISRRRSRPSGSIWSRASPKPCSARAGRRPPAPAAHFAFWTRRAALMKLAASFAARVPRTRWRGRAASSFICRRRMSRRSSSIRGRSPISPATPISCACPRRSARGMRAIVDLFLDRLEAAGDESQMFVHYPSQGDLGAKISALSDARVVWGGDAKVALFAPLPLRNGGKSIWFGDRFSFSTINGAALDKLDEPALRALAKKLHNDVFVFDQMACSSPHALYVVGEAAAHWPAVRAPPRRLRARMDDGRSQGPGRARDRQDDGCVLCGGNGTRFVGQLAGHEPDQRRGQRAGAAGTAGRRRLPERRLHPLARRGRDASSARATRRSPISAGSGARSKRSPPPARGPASSRWAPIGTALDFDFIWDGYDIPFELTRLIRIS